jgi:hypothetical protein
LRNDNRKELDNNDCINIGRKSHQHDREVFETTSHEGTKESEPLLIGKDCFEIAPTSIHAFNGATRGGIVHDVVVIERTEVHELY